MRRGGVRPLIQTCQLASFGYSTLLWDLSARHWCINIFTFNCCPPPPPARNIWPDRKNGPNVDGRTLVTLLKDSRCVPNHILLYWTLLQSAFTLSRVRTQNGSKNWPLIDQLHYKLLSFWNMLFQNIFLYIIILSDICICIELYAIYWCQIAAASW